VFGQPSSPDLRAATLEEAAEEDEDQEEEEEEEEEEEVVVVEEEEEEEAQPTGPLFRLLMRSGSTKTSGPLICPMDTRS
jgi:hypothetical protein